MIAFRKLSSGKNEIQFLHHSDILRHNLSVFRNQSSQFIQNPPHLVLFVHAQFLQFFVILRRGGGLYKQGAARGGFVDQDTADLKFVLLFHRNAHMPVADGAEMVGHAILIGAHDSLHLFPHLILRPENIAPQALQQL